MLSVGAAITVLPLVLALTAPSLAAQNFHLAGAKQSGKPKFSTARTIDETTLGARFSVPTMPMPTKKKSRSLDGIIDNLPLVVRDLPDSSSKQAVSDYDHARLLSPQGAAAMFVHSWQGLNVQSGSEAAVSQYGHDLALGQSQDLSQEADAATGALTQDPRNADRLSNSAVALFFLAMGNAYGQPVNSYQDFQFGNAVRLTQNSLDLLAKADSSFPTSRTVKLNEAALASPTAQIGPPTASMRTAIDVAQDLVNQNSGDKEAGILLADLKARETTSSKDLSRQLGLLAPLFADIRARPLAEAMAGDVCLENAYRESVAAPYYARSLARRALTNYDKALTVSSDPGLYAGRAAALEFLNDPRDAIVAQRLAVKLAQNSPDLLLRLGHLQAETGNGAAMANTEDRVRGLAFGSWNPRLVDIWPTDPVKDQTQQDLESNTRGRLSFSYGAARDHVTVSGGPMGGGGFIINLDLVPKLDYGYRVTGGDFAPTAAIVGGMAAAVLKKSASQGDAQDSFWLRNKSRFPGLANAETDLRASAPDRDIPYASDGVRMATGQQPAATPTPAFTAIGIAGQALDFVQTTFRMAGRYADAARVCAANKDSLCAGESEYLARNYAQALSDFQAEASTSSTSANSTPDPTPHLYAAVAAQALHKTDEARSQFQAAASAPTSGFSVAPPFAAQVGLADLELDGGDARSALALYTKALDGMNASTVQDPKLAATQERAYNNRGIARLLQIQPNRSEPPECSKDPAPCRDTETDFTFAQQIDPENPVYLLNLGWVSRLLGKTAEAARYLHQATQRSPNLYPALNDHGVLAARAGHYDTARADFQKALAAKPTYDLAAWNLGVLLIKHGSGPEDVLRGEAYLDKAIKENHGLRNSDLAYRTDERVYRFVSLPKLLHGYRFGQNYALAAVALSWLAILAVTFQVIFNFLKHKLRDKSMERIEESHKMGWLRGLLPWSRSAGRPRAGSWLPWLLTIPILVAITGFTAWRAGSDGWTTIAALALFATAIAVVTHEMGHYVGALIVRAQVRPAYWGSGLGLAVVFALLPFDVAMGPYLGHWGRRQVKEGSFSRTWRVRWPISSRPPSPTRSSSISPCRSFDSSRNSSSPSARTRSSPSSPWMDTR